MRDGEQAKDRRRFWRAAFDARARLMTRDGNQVVKLEDISLKGALVQTGTAASLKAGDDCQLHLDLSIDTHIVMWMTAVHVEGRNVGLRCDSIDLDSVTHLRRLVELNAGDPGILERELSALTR
ncbi:MAG TPA: PilZ domain-containing protein [Rhodocyclaceae bacterium]|nr:PilZ domain-containing protein [Rhodocyclaceae bacterium]